MVPLLDVGLGYNTSSKIVEVISSCTLVFLPFPFSIFCLPFSVFYLVFSSYFSFFPTSFKRFFSKTFLTFSTFSLSYAISLLYSLSSRPAIALASNTFLPAASMELNLSFSKGDTYCRLHSRYQETPQRWIEVHVCSYNRENM